MLMAECTYCLVAHEASLELETGGSIKASERVELVEVQELGRAAEEPVVVAYVAAEQAWHPRCVNRSLT